MVPRNAVSTIGERVVQSLTNVGISIEKINSSVAGAKDLYRMGGGTRIQGRFGMLSQYHQRMENNRSAVTAEEFITQACEQVGQSMKAFVDYRDMLYKSNAEQHIFQRKNIDVLLGAMLSVSNNNLVFSSEDVRKYRRLFASIQKEYNDEVSRKEDLTRKNIARAVSDYEEKFNDKGDRYEQFNSLAQHVAMSDLFRPPLEKHLNVSRAREIVSANIAKLENREKAWEMLCPVIRDLIRENGMGKGLLFKPPQEWTENTQQKFIAAVSKNLSANALSIVGERQALFTDAPVISDLDSDSIKSIFVSPSNYGDLVSSQIEQKQEGNSAGVSPR